MENNLKIARREYKPNTLFISATNNLKSPLRVAILKEAEYLDRIAEIKETTDKERRKYLQSLENDIVNSEGGVIYCGETKRWAKKV
jgi:hypothetical protein